MADAPKTTPRILVVEDEYLIRMLLEDMLTDLGYDIAGAVGTIADASELAANAEFDVAILDVNLDGKEIYPVAEILAKRGKPSSSSAAMAKAAWPKPIAAVLIAEAVPVRAAQGRLASILAS